jgi:hypothetical protein
MNKHLGTKLEAAMEQAAQEVLSIRESRPAYVG